MHLFNPGHHKRASADYLAASRRDLPLPCDVKLASQNTTSVFFYFLSRAKHGP